MAVGTTHPDYDKMLPRWTKCREWASGVNAVRTSKNIEDYVPKLEDQEANQYDSYVARGMFYSATRRTVKALLGMIFRRPITFSHEDHSYFKDKMRKLELEELIEEATEELLKVGRFGLLADAPQIPVPGDEPYIVGYDAESIINWRQVVVNGEEIFTLVVLKEQVQQPTKDDIYVLETVTQYRVLRINNDGLYEQQMYVDTQPDARAGVDADGNRYQLKWSVTPGNMTEIPFVILGPTGLEEDVAVPPIEDLVEMNISHFRSSVDLEHGLHFSALPTAWVAGFPAGTELKMGSASAWVSEDTDAKAGFLEFKGQGLGAIERTLTKKESLMALLGAKLLEGNTESVESSSTHLIKRAGENSVLSSIAKASTTGFNRAFHWVESLRGGKTEGFTTTLNDDFDVRTMSPQQFTALMLGWQGGSITDEVMAYNMLKGELLPPGATLAEATKNIEENLSKVLERNKVEASVETTPDVVPTPQLKTTAEKPLDPPAKS